MTLLTWTSAGFFCSAGGFYIDPSRAVERAVITHGHADHARAGCSRYLTSDAGVAILRHRLGAGIALTGLPYGKTVRLGEVDLSLHPAGHILGSAQVRLDHRGEVWVFTGDFKTEPEGTCAPFEPIRCHTLVTESTFALPLFRWRPQESVAKEINAWWRENKRLGRTSVLLAYALGKAQRVLAGLDATIGPIAAHGAIEAINRLYRAAAVRLPPTVSPESLGAGTSCRSALVVMPPGIAWRNRFPEAACAMASGWMQLERHRRSRGVERGFILSDHADWDSLLGVIGGSEAESVWTHHGFAEPLARWLRKAGRSALAFPAQRE